MRKNHKKVFMREDDGLTNKDIENSIKEALLEQGIDMELITITVKDGPKIIVKGEVDSDNDKAIIIQTIKDTVYTEEVIDNIIVIGDEDGTVEEDEDDADREELMDEDNQSFGSSDVFEALEDGQPYVPPTTDSFEKSFETKRNNKKKRKK